MSTKSIQQQILGLIGGLLICYAVAALGALASFQAQSIYDELIQPVWAPPAWLFGPVWMVLYALMAVAVWLVWRQTQWPTNRMALTWFLIQLVLNALWSWLFFAWLQGAGSFVNIVGLWLVILLTILAFWRFNRLAATLLIPYLLWVSFAAALNFAMWQLNPNILS